MNFYDLYSYEKNEDLIFDICEHFKIKKPKTRINVYGYLDICFNINLNTYLVQVNDSYVSLKKEDIKRKGQKHRKYYFSEIRRFYCGNIWWELIKFIHQDSAL